MFLPFSPGLPNIDWLDLQYRLSRSPRSRLFQHLEYSQNAFAIEMEELADVVASLIAFGLQGIDLFRDMNKRLERLGIVNGRVHGSKQHSIQGNTFEPDHVLIQYSATCGTIVQFREHNAFARAPAVRRPDPEALWHQH